MPALGSPTVRSRSGTVSMRKSPSSQSGTSSQLTWHATRASGTGRIEYPAATVWSLAFWL